VNISDSVVAALRLEEFGDDPQTIVCDEDQQQPAKRVVNGSGSRITFRLQFGHYEEKENGVDQEVEDISALHHDA
ncbi:MAG: hypothetical protein J6Y78_18215, partial [Paludibacteraceae bacterium]|nr:hypothetical protein [Paludibacteraceae bacterium]